MGTISCACGGVRLEAVGAPLRAVEKSMLYSISLVLVVLWVLGLVSSYTMGGFIHILLVIAVIMVALQLIQGRRV